MAGEASRGGGDRHRDITEESLQQRDRGLRLVFKQVPGAIWATDGDLRITYAVGRLRESAGLSDARMVGTTITDLLGTSEPTEPFLAHHRAALAGQRSSFVYDFRGRCYGVFLEPLRNQRGDISGCVGVAVDVTEQRRAEAELARSEARLA